ncbi:MAG: hypothetical protein N2646_09380, partial [Bellilinea sp.]|nr:hypothetical protein [Bellilinea sp.]
AWDLGRIDAVPFLLIYTLSFGVVAGVSIYEMSPRAVGKAHRPGRARRGVRLGGYLTEKRPDGSQAERGWLHSALAELIRGAGFSAEARPLAIRDFVSVIGEGGMIIASVSHEIGAHSPITKRGGHLVLVFGAVLEKDEPLALLLHNPSGRTDALRVNAQIPVERFAAAYTGRGITVHQI